MADGSCPFLLVAVNAKYIHTCLAVYDLAAFAEAHGQEAETVEYTINETEEEILDGILSRKPDGIFFACYIWNISRIESLLPRLHEALPSAAVYLGGPEVSYDAEERLRKFPYLGGIAVGEGEAVLTELLAYWPSRAAMGRILKARTLLPLDEIPFPYTEEMLRTAGSRGKILYYETSRGCPFSCSYCLSSIREPVRLRSMPLVKTELQKFLDACVPQVKFVDRTFNCSHEHAREIWEYLLEHDNGITNFHFEIGADLLRDADLELLRKMRPGYVQLEIGVQSVNERTIAAVSRTMDLDRLKHAVTEIRRGRNIHQHLDLIAGLPFEDYGSFRKSFDEVFALQPDQLQLGFLKVLKGTEMAKAAAAYGIISDREAPYEVIRTPWISEEELGRLARMARMVDIYYNTAQFTRSLPYLVGCAEDAFSFFEALAGYYAEHGYPTAGDSRVRRYEILRDFALSGKLRTAPETEELTERLSVDLYLREKLKHRPEWVHDLSGRYAFDYSRRDPLTYNAEVKEI